MANATTSTFTPGTPGRKEGPLILSKRIRSIKPSGTAKMRMIANALKESGAHVINFAAGELDIDTTEVIKTAAKAAVDAGRNVYTPTLGLTSLRNLVAQKVSAHCGVEYQSSEVAITAGAKQALYNTAIVLLDPGDEVLIPQPYWVTFPAQIEIADAKPVFIDTRPSGYHLLCADVERAVTPRTKAIIINSPNNPTGAVYAAEELEKIARLALERGFWIVFDECYASLVRNGYTHSNIVKLYPEVKERAVLVNSFSKSYALTGWRVGYASAPAPVIKAMESLQGHSTSNPNSIAQYAVQAALEADNKKFMADVNSLLDERVAAALNIVAQMHGVSAAPAEGAFYMFLNVEAKIGKSFRGQVVADVDQFCEMALSEANVAIVSGSAFGDPSAIRVSYAISTEDIIEGLNRLKQFSNDIQ
jgi:aspartate aminotransferase